jgi:hypothetical protein
MLTSNPITGHSPQPVPSTSHPLRSILCYLSMSFCIFYITISQEVSCPKFWVCFLFISYTYIAHHTLLHFAILTIFSDLYKPWSSSLCNRTITNCPQDVILLKLNCDPQVNMTNFTHIYINILCMDINKNINRIYNCNLWVICILYTHIYYISWTCKLVRWQQNVEYVIVTKYIYAVQTIIKFLHKRNKGFT